jgi:tetratricopeptide (TPR) repeat protein
MQGCFADALRHAMRALEIAEAANHAYSLASEANQVGFLRLMKGDFADAVRLLERAVEMWRTLQNPPWAHLLAALGLSYCRIGQQARGLALLKDALALRQGVDILLPADVALAEGYLIAGRIGDAAAQAGRALEAAREKRRRGREAYALLVLAEAIARAEGPDTEAAHARYGQALSLAEELGMHPFAARCHLGLGALSGRTGRRDRALDHLGRASAMFAEMDMGFWRGEAERELRALT